MNHRIDLFYPFLNKKRYNLGSLRLVSLDVTGENNDYAISRSLDTVNKVYTMTNCTESNSLKLGSRLNKIIKIFFVGMVDFWMIILFKTKVHFSLEINLRNSNEISDHWDYRFVFFFAERTSCGHTRVPTWYMTWKTLGIVGARDVTLDKLTR